MRGKGSSDLKNHLSKVGTAITGTCAASAVEVVWVSECGQSNHNLCLDPCQAPTPESLMPALLPSGASVLVLGDGDVSSKNSIIHILCKFIWNILQGKSHARPKKETNKQNKRDKKQQLNKLKRIEIITKNFFPTTVVEN